jgi:hypothetical protein
MPVELIKALPLTLRAAGLNEKWLQDQIQADPSILGLGDLEVAGREHRQPVGGRIDFLLRNAEADTYYEVEIMLGALDESHIIRTIEYWDIERQRRPNAEHRAVIVAEQITTRFFNVLRLLNRSVPLIAIKLSGFRTTETNLVLHPVIVLDVVEEVFDDDLVDRAEQSDRPYWEKKSPVTLTIMDKIVALLRASEIDPRVTYNRHHIAIGSTGRNFCWFYQRKTRDRAHIRLLVGSDLREAILSQLQSNGVDASPTGTRSIAFGITLPELERQSVNVAEALKQAEGASK